MRNQLVPDIVAVNGREVFYMQSGPRDCERVFLALHGFMSDYRSLQIVVENLAVDSGTSILLPDLPGFGSSEAFTDGEPRLDDYVDWVSAFLSAAAPSAKQITLMGYSFGCYIAIEFTARNPNMVGDLILVAPVIRMATPVRLYSTLMENLVTLSLDTAKVLYKWRPHFDLTNLYLAGSRHPDRVIKMLKHRREDLSTLQPKVVLGIWRELFNTDLLESAPKVLSPVFTVIAKGDTLAVNAATDSFMQLVPADHKETHVLERSGHMVPFEEPELIVALMNSRFFGVEAARAVR